MPRYKVTLLVRELYDIEADSEDAAAEIAQTYGPGTDCEPYEHEIRDTAVEEWGCQGTR